MSAKINSNYLESYSNQFTSNICDNYFSSRKYITGADIVQLTPSLQVNYFIIKALFEAWQLELEKLKNNPYFDYRDNSVHHALKEFMNVLSRSIKIERKHLEPLIKQAVISSIFLASDPVEFYSSEMEKVNENDINHYLKENKKYYKWHHELIINLIDRAGLGQNLEAFKKALENNYENLSKNLATTESLLQTLVAIAPIDDQALFFNENKLEKESESLVEEAQPIENAEVDAIEEPVLENASVGLDSSKSNTQAKKIDAKATWTRYESENYGALKSDTKELFENLGLNHRFMFTKELFSGNPDLLKNALKSVENCNSFHEAIEMINVRFVEELDWNLNSDAVDEFLQLIYIKFQKKS
jgi:hypothetical protein